MHEISLYIKITIGGFETATCAKMWLSDSHVLFCVITSTSPTLRLLEMFFFMIACILEHSENIGSRVRVLQTGAVFTNAQKYVPIEWVQRYCLKADAYIGVPLIYADFNITSIYLVTMSPDQLYRWHVTVLSYRSVTAHFALICTHARRRVRYHMRVCKLLFPTYGMTLYHSSFIPIVTIVVRFRATLICAAMWVFSHCSK